MAYQVLIVDDNENNRFTMKSVLKPLDLQIFEAKNGSEALEYLLKSTCDLIILDIQLPDYSGFEIAKMIKSKKSTMAIPIIFATAVFKSEDYILKGYELGAVDYILKPFKAELVISKVKYYKSVAEERSALINQLKQKNDELNQHNKNLKLMQEMLSEAVEDWRLLGNNIPLNIEMYDKSSQLTFQNHYGDKKMMKVFHLEHNKSIVKQLEITFEIKKMFKEIYCLENHAGKKYYEISSIYINHKTNPRVMLLINDVTLERNQLEGIEYIGFHDQLTGLWNRHYFMQYVQKMHIENLVPISILMADVNGLKLINDGFGHTAGDELIKVAARCMRNNSPEKTIIARWGGDEFLLLIPNTNECKAQEISDGITEEISKVKIADKFPVSIAIGCVTCEEEAFHLETLIKEAEDKMYINKMQNQSSYRNFIVESLKSALFEQDYESRDHTVRIGEMAQKVAEHLNLPQNDIDKLKLLGSLHDIGKIGVSNVILNQNFKLSDIDWITIKRHPEIGYRICSGVPELSSIANLILAHHERWDGKGYPRRLKGADIPLLSRLISILDAFDVITHNRPYKEAKSPEWAMDEIRKCSGTQFDPKLVNVFERVYNQLIEKGEAF